MGEAKRQPTAMHKNIFKTVIGNLPFDFSGWNGCNKDRFGFQHKLMIVVPIIEVKHECTRVNEMERK